MDEETKPKSSKRIRADAIKQFRCKNLIAVIENPHNVKNIGTVIRNVNALGVEKVYVVDQNQSLPDDWQELRERKSVSKTSVSAVKWTFVKRFESTVKCFDHLEKNGFQSIATSPHIKGQENVLLHEGDYTEHTKLAVWFGSETIGISDLAVARSAFCVNIPMFGMIESLNLGTSSGIVLYEVAKQRREYQSKYRRGKKKGKRATPLPTVMPTKEGSRNVMTEHKNQVVRQLKVARGIMRKDRKVLAALAEFDRTGKNPGGAEQELSPKKPKT